MLSPSSVSPHILWVVLVLVIVQLGFAGNAIVIKAGGKDLGVHPLIMTTLRDAFAFPVLLIAAAYFEGFRLPRSSDLPIIVLLSVTGTFGNQLLFILGLYYTSPNTASIFQPSVPVITTVLGVLFGLEALELDKPSGRLKVAGIVSTSLGGAVIVLTHRSPTPQAVSDPNDFLLGVGCLLGGCTCMAAYMLLQKRYIFSQVHNNPHQNAGPRYPPIHITAWVYGVAAGMMILCAFWYTLVGRNEVYVVPASAMWPLLYMVFVTSAACYGLLSWANKYTSPTVVTSFWPLQVPGVAFLSYIFFGETLRLFDLVGAASIIAGLLCVTYSRHLEEEQRRKPLVLSS